MCNTDLRCGVWGVSGWVEGREDKEEDLRRRRAPLIAAPRPGRRVVIKTVCGVPPFFLAPQSPLRP
jgi:hypothetical protein